MSSKKPLPKKYHPSEHPGDKIYIDEKSNKVTLFDLLLYIVILF